MHQRGKNHILIEKYYVIQFPNMLRFFSSLYLFLQYLKQRFAEASSSRWEVYLCRYRCLV